jgi:rod shape-determining protein MreD
MNKLKFITGIIIFALLQTAILNRLAIFSIKPDLLFISVIIASLYFSCGWAIVFSMLAGFLKDITCLNSNSLYTILFILWSFAVIKLSRKISFDNDYVKLALLVIVVMLNDIIIRLIFLFLGNFISLGIFLRIIFLDSLYTALLFPLVLNLTRKLSLVSE